MRFRFVSMGLKGRRWLEVKTVCGWEWERIGIVQGGKLTVFESKNAYVDMAGIRLRAEQWVKEALKRKKDPSNGG